MKFCSDSYWFSYFSYFSLLMFVLWVFLFRPRRFRSLSSATLPAKCGTLSSSFWSVINVISCYYCSLLFILLSFLFKISLSLYSLVMADCFSHKPASISSIFLLRIFLLAYNEPIVLVF